MNPLPNQTSFLDDPPTFGGVTYSPEHDEARLSTSLGKVYSLMLDGQWRTISEIAAQCECSEAGASARLRDLRKAAWKDRYPNRGVDRERVSGGLFKYRMLK